MTQFPHSYSIQSSATVSGPVALERSGLPRLESLPPVEFGGPGDHWSPEDLLVGAVADCFLLSFRAIAAASKFAWTSLTCEVTGKLDRVERKVCFVEFQIQAKLVIPTDSAVDRAKHLLEKAEQTCFITNSLSAKVHLETHVENQ
jgi:organic hydroperoxide reductase OsmC/OhrA